MKELESLEELKISPERIQEVRHACQLNGIKRDLALANIIDAIIANLLNASYPQEQKIADKLAAIEITELFSKEDQRKLYAKMIRAISIPPTASPPHGSQSVH